MVEEVEAYIREKGYHFNAQSFIDYYEADGWYYGHGANRRKVVRWKQCCATWENQWRRDHSQDMFPQYTPEPPAIQPQEPQGKYYAFNVAFDTQAEADAFDEQQRAIRDGFVNGKYKVESNSVEEYMIQNCPVRLEGDTIYACDV